MKITITSLGTMGDVRPYVALALGLKQKGHQITLGVDKSFEDFIRAHGLGFSPINADPKAALDEAPKEIQKKQWLYFKWVKSKYEQVIDELFQETMRACDGADLILFSSLSVAAGHVAAAKNIPAIGAFLQPSTPSRSIPSLMGKPLPRGLPFRGLYNYTSSLYEGRIFFRLIYKILNKARQEHLDLKPLPWKTYANFSISDAPILYGYSPTVLPKPADWHSNIFVTGYWFLNSAPGWAPPPELEAFLKGGEKPVYIGFGSMVDKEKDELLEIVLHALEIAGKRAVLLSGWSGIGDHLNLPANIFKTSQVPHDWLFPQMAAVVHHGGAGTTAAGFRAGVPSVVIPYFVDQPFWARLAKEHQLGPAPIYRNKLTASNLAKAILEACQTKQYQTNAYQLGQKIQAEDGVATAIKYIDQLMQDPQKIIEIYQHKVRI